MQVTVVLNLGMHLFVLNVDLFGVIAARRLTTARAVRTFGAQAACWQTSPFHFTISSLISVLGASAIFDSHVLISLVCNHARVSLFRLQRSCAACDAICPCNTCAADPARKAKLGRDSVLLIVSRRSSLFQF